MITSVVIALCLWVKWHYRKVARSLQKLSRELSLVGVPGVEPPPTAALDATKPIAVVLAGGYGGLGIHTLLQIPRVFPAQFGQVMFVSVGMIDAGTFKGETEMAALEAKTAADLGKFVDLARHHLGWSAGARSSLATEAVAELERLCREIHREYPHAVFFAGKLVFRDERWWQRVMHNETAHAVQRRLELDGLTMVVLPIRMAR